MSTPLIAWARQMQAIAQTGLTYATDEYDRERYAQLHELAAEVFAAAAGPEQRVEPILDLFHREDGYATPKVDVRAGVFRDNKILLVREREDGRWSLPGGWADVDDRPSLAAEREVREESGYLVRATKLVALHDRNLHGHDPYPFHAYKLFFLCELLGGEATVTNETDGVEFFAEDALPALSITRVVPAQIAMLFAHYRNPALATEFD